MKRVNLLHIPVAFILAALATCKKYDPTPAGCGTILAKEAFISVRSTSFDTITVTKEVWHYQAIVRTSDSTLTTIYLTEKEYNQLKEGQPVCYDTNLRPQ